MRRTTSSAIVAVVWALGAAASAATVATTTPAESPLSGTNGELTWQARGLYTTTATATPATDGATAYNLRHRPEFGGEMSGVARLIINGNTLCSGALLGTGRHVLTAAHCVTDAFGQSTFSSGQAQFPVTANANPYTGSFANVAMQSVTVHPGWTGNITSVGNDLAIITLAAVAPAGADRYDLYTASDEIGQVGTKSGYGRTGTGATGDTLGTDWRRGQNTYEMTALDFWGDGESNPNILMYDFDNGTSGNDGFGFFFGPSFQNTGLGLNEVMSAPGDSGGPTFINGQLAGITSFGLRLAANTGQSSDTDTFLNSTYGEFAGDTRVSGYSSWIMATIPEPGTWALWLAGLPLLGAIARRRRARSA